MKILRLEDPLFPDLIQGTFVGRPLYLEVKSCTLVGRRIAMFPDAITARAKGTWRNWRA